MANWVTTWFYMQSAEEGGDYAQVRGDSSTEQFRDVYRRCLAVFFLSARKANPDARLVLYLNRPWKRDSSAVSAEVHDLMNQLGVEYRVLNYEHRPPSTFASSWRNQFFVIDVLNDLADSLGPEDLWLVLDSDVVWSSGRSTSGMWERLRLDGISTYSPGYQHSYVVNGLSISGLSALGACAGLEENSHLDYSGGEFVGGSGRSIQSLSEESRRVWKVLMSHHHRDIKVQFEEAHLLSLAYATLGVSTGGMNDYIRRLWTQPLKYQNVSLEDSDLVLWHVPAEKKYGIRRLYAKTMSKSVGDLLSMADESWMDMCRRELGIPKNSPFKIIRDISQVLTTRGLVGGRRLLAVSRAVKRH